MKPSTKTIKILDSAMAHIKSVPYKVSARWLFYRLFQEGIYKNKGDYHTKFKSTISKARKNFYGEWNPDTLADDTRRIYFYGNGYLSEEEWLEGLDCNLDKIQNQDYVLMIWYEAKAMHGQFKEYTNNIPLVPFGGDPSIPYKWEIAKALENLKGRYDKPIKVLYFGDCDTKGRMIYKAALKDVKDWCDVDFEFIYCGLTLEQAKGLGMPENFEKPGQYQWEALTDDQAKQIILSNVEKYQDAERFTEIGEEEQRILSKAKNLLEAA